MTDSYESIDVMFPIDEPHQGIYQEQFLAGIEHIKTKKVAITSIVRNVSNVCENNLERVVEFLSYFDKENSSVYIYENDSIDDTAAKIQYYIDMNELNNQVYLKSEQLGTPYMPLSSSTVRTTNMANARIACYNMIENPEKYDYFIVLDLDFIDLSFNGLVNSFGWLSNNKAIHGICGNTFENLTGNQYNPKYTNYDSFAFRLNHWDPIPMGWYPNFILPIGSKPIPVNSGFGGSCIYRAEKYKPLYVGTDCEHVTLHQNLKSLFDFQLYYNPSQICRIN